MTSQIINSPPRGPCVPQVPLPQTNYGTLEHTGNVQAPLEMITDIPLDFSWMTAMYKFVDSFYISTQSKSREKLWSTLVMKAAVGFRVWELIPFFGSRWWTGTVVYRFTVIKPPRVSGKLLIRYFFNRVDPAVNYPEEDELRRGIVKEWDLALTNQCEIEIPGELPLRARPSVWANTAPLYATDSRYIFSVPHPLIREVGTISVEMAQHLAPGGIFPDSFAVYVERCFKNAQFYTSMDIRNSYDVACSDYWGGNV